VLVYSARSGQFERSWTTVTVDATGGVAGGDIAIGAYGEVYVAEPARRAVGVYDAAGRHLRDPHLAGAPTVDDRPMQVALSAGGAVLIAGIQHLQVLSPAGAAGPMSFVPSITSATFARGGSEWLGSSAFGALQVGAAGRPLRILSAPVKEAGGQGELSPDFGATDVAAGPGDSVWLAATRPAARTQR
jgi:hypothetical protein